MAKGFIVDAYADQGGVSKTQKEWLKHYDGENTLMIPSGVFLTLASSFYGNYPHFLKDLREKDLANQKWFLTGSQAIFFTQGNDLIARVTQYAGKTKFKIREHEVFVPSLTTKDKFPSLDNLPSEWHPLLFAIAGKENASTSVDSIVDSLRIISGYHAREMQLRVPYKKDVEASQENMLVRTIRYGYGIASFRIDLCGDPKKDVGRTRCMAKRNE